MTLLELLQLLRKHIALVIVLPVVCALGAAIYCYGFMANQYTSEVSLYVLYTSDSEDSSASANTNSELSASQQLANDIAVLVKSNSVMTATAESLGLENLNGYNITVSSSTTNRIITLSVTGKKPESVALVASALATQTSTRAVDIMEFKAVNIVDDAQIPTAPSGPNRPMYVAVALLAGLFLAIALIVLMDMLNTAVKTREEAEELFELPVLGVMPLAKKGK